jgi:PAS domain S-box-containing protein
MNILDTRTVLFSYIITNAICMVVMVSLWWQNRHRSPELAFWMADFIMQFTGVLLLALRGILPDFFSMVLSNTLIISGTLLLFIGLERFTRKNSFQWHNYIFLAVFIFIQTYFAFMRPSLQMRTVNISFGILVFCLQCAWLLLRRIKTPDWQDARRVGFVFVAFSFVSLIRIFVDLALPPENDFFKSGLYDTFPILIYQMLYIILTFSLFLMLNRRLLASLENDVVEMKLAEETLKISEEKFFTAFQTSPYAISITRVEDGKFIDVNKAFTSIAGFTRAEALFDSSIGLNLWVNEEDRRGIVSALRAGQSVEGKEFHFRRKNGEIIIGMFSAQLIQLNQALCIFSSINDVTARRQAEEALRESENRFHSLYHNATIGMYRTTPDGRILLLNPAGVRMLGYDSLEEITKRNLEEDGFEPGYERIQFHERMKREGTIVGLESVWDKKDGSKIYVRESATAVKDDSGTIIYYDGTFENITQSKHVEETLRIAEEKYRSIFENATVGIFQSVPQGFFLNVNPSMARIFGYSNPQEMVEAIKDISSQIYVNADERNLFSKLLQGNGFVQNFEGYNRRKDNSIIWTSTNARCIRDANGNALYYEGFLQDITERRQAEDSLRASEERFRAILDNIVDGYYEVDLKGRLTFVNPAYAEMLGYENNEIIGMDYHQYMSRETAKIVFQTFNRVYRLQEPEHAANWEWIRKDGTRLPNEISISTIKSADEGIVGFRGIVRDITERKQAEDSLRESESSLQGILRSTADGILAVGEENKVLFANERFTEIWRIPQEVISSRDDSVLLQYVLDQLSDPQDFLQKVQFLYKSKSESFDVVYFKDGRVFERLSRPLMQADEIRGRVWSFRDITARRQAEKLQDATYRIAQSADQAESLEALYPAIHTIIQEIMVAANFYIALYDEKNDLISFPYFIDEEDSQASPQKPGRGLTEYVLHSAKSTLCDDALYQELIRSGEIELVGAHSPIWLGVPLLIEGKTIGVMVVQDYKNASAYSEREQRILEFVSSQIAMAIYRKQSEEALKEYNTRLEANVEERTRELREAQEQLVRQEKLAVLGQMAGSVGHELRNPLGVISSSVYYLKLVQPDADDVIKKHLGIIDQEVRTSDKIITDLLDFARVKSMDREAVCVSDLICQTLERFPAPASVEVILEIPTNLPQIFVDSRQMTQVLGNLIVNSCQAMKDGGKLTVSSNQLSVDTTPLVTDNWILITVKDTGVGIPPENMGKLFEPLFTTKTKGIGLGLAVSKKLIEANGGRIEVDSEAGIGSTFTVWLPVK